MRKVSVLLLCLFLLTGCHSQKTTTQDTIYRDGTITTVASGYGGEFEVETIVNNDEIVDIIVKENNETPSIGGVAIEQMIEIMKEKNSYDVDTISGATFSSQALKDAVKEAMEQLRK